MRFWIDFREDELSPRGSRLLLGNNSASHCLYAHAGLVVINIRMVFSPQYYIFYFVVPMGILSWEIRVAFPEESQLRVSRATQP